MQVLPGDDISTSEIAALIDELIDNRLLYPYEVDGKKYWHVINWNVLQKVERPNFIYPSPQFGEHSPNIPRSLNEHSPPEGSGKESKGKESNGRESNARPHDEFEKEKKADGPESFTAALSAIRKWAAAESFVTLLKIKEAVNYDPERFGPVSLEVEKFVAKYHAKMGKDPVAYLMENFMVWLTNAKTYNRPTNTGNGTKKSNTGQSVGRSAAVAYLQTAHSGFWREFTENDLVILSKCRDDTQLQQRASEIVKKRTKNAEFAPVSSAINTLSDNFKIPTA